MKKSWVNELEENNELLEPPQSKNDSYILTDGWYERTYPY